MFNYFRRLLTSIAALMLFIPCAHADWEYTKWGMTPDELIAASNAGAKPINDTQQGGLKKEGLLPLLEAPYQLAGKYSFQAIFYFDSRKQLKEVNLNLKQINQQKDLPDLLTKLYGPPLFEAPSSILWSSSWQDQGSHNTVKLTLMGFAADLTYLQSELPEVAGEFVGFRLQKASECSLPYGVQLQRDWNAFLSRAPNSQQRDRAVGAYKKGLEPPLQGKETVALDERMKAAICQSERNLADKEFPTWEHTLQTVIWE